MNRSAFHEFNIPVLRHGIILLIVFLFSFYSFGYATLNGNVDYKILLILSLLACLALFPSKLGLFSGTTWFLYLAFVGLSTLSIFLRPTASLDSLIAVLPMLLLSGAIVISFAKPDESEAGAFKWGLSGCLLLLVLGAISQQFGFPIKSKFAEFGEFIPIVSMWNEKYYAFWLVFLMWATISFHWRRNITSIGVVVGIMVTTGVAIFTGYSGSAKVAFVLSIALFLVMQIRYSRWLRLWQSLMCVYVIGLPFAWSLLPHSWLESVRSVGFHYASYRVDLYNFTVKAILENWFFGYGFGSAAAVLAPSGMDTGGHPHNIVLLFWLELGLLGACLLAIATTTLLSVIHNRTRGGQNAPAVWALFGSGLVVFSFSFDVWHPGMALIYGMWLALIMLSSQNKVHAQAPAPSGPTEQSV